MLPLEALTREARSLADGAAAPAAGEVEVARVMQICNACRYCEGFCAVFQAMTRRLAFPPADAHYFANLCHSCGACLHACQYAPPHEFAVNVPQALAVVRGATYAGFAWPAPCGRLYRRAGATVAVALAAALALFLALAAARMGSLIHAPLAGDFYAVFSHRMLALTFGAVFAFALVALAIGVARFWRGITPGAASGAAARAAARDVLTLKYLDGGHGEGCNDADDAFTLARQRFHHATFYGFLLCFAATCVATFYHTVLGEPAPYPLWSLPVLLGTVGGVGLLAGPAGLLWLHVIRDPRHDDPAQKPMDYGFIALLLLTSASGLALLAWRDSAAMASLLAVHLGAVMALFLTLPYGKFGHGLYRAAALLKWEVERRLANPLQLTDD
jgi:citrate/tricarballylate utilization protein